MYAYRELGEFDAQGRAQVIKYVPDNVQLVSALDKHTGRVYVFMVTTKDVAKGQELVLDYDIGDLRVEEWFEAPWLDEVSLPSKSVSRIRVSCINVQNWLAKGHQLD
jgi:hypothetical protein